MSRHTPLLIAVLSMAACAANPFLDGSKPHRTGEGFRNTYPHPEKGSFWQWKWEQWRAGLPDKPPGGYRFETARTDTAFLRMNRRETTATWVGHATVLLQTAGVNVITDPQFSERASPVPFAGPKRVVPATPALADLPHIDAVLISHDHYDHLDAASVKALARQPGGSPRFFVGLGTKAWFAEQGITDVVELDWWQSLEFKGVEVTFVPVQHWSKRTLTDTNQRLWGGWVLRHPGFSFFFTGDAGYSRDFADIGARFGGVDLAAIPIGAYEPRWFMKIMHLNPEEAVRTHRDVKSRASLGIHWGTFDDLTDESLYEPPAALAREARKAGLAQDEFFVLKHGETRRFARR
jgi:L-ascorbate metabolism protein UlaG (beta-lactamase superfamily)